MAGLQTRANMRFLKVSRIIQAVNQRCNLTLFNICLDFLRSRDHGSKLEILPPHSLL